jgi:hypothetical protein
MQRLESVQNRPRRATPFQHPYYETPRQRQRRSFVDEIARELDRWAPMQARLASARILETGWPV